MTSATTTAYTITNYGHEPTRVTIHDLRGKENSMDLDTNAFEVIKYEGVTQEEFENNSEVQRNHCEEMENIIKEHLGASRVIIYQHVFRTRGAALTGDQCNDNHRNPGFLVHSDIDGPGVQGKLVQLLGDEKAKEIMKHRYAAFNIWRPLGSNPIVDKPLAICDYRSIDAEKDIHPLEVRGSTNTSTARTISPNVQDTHRWYYLSEMRSNEMFIFKMFDSKVDVAHYAFNTASINKDVLLSNMEQRSIEMRCLVSYDY